MKRLFVITSILSIIFAIPGCPTEKVQNSGYNIIREENKIEIVGVNKITVLSDCGHMFILDLQDGRRIKGTLNLETGKEAHEKVVRLINQSIQPSVFLQRYDSDDKIWIIDLKLKVSECVEESCKLKELSLTDWLVKEGLAWNF